MGFIANTFGAVTDTSKGAGFQAPGTNADQLQQAYGQTQSGLAQQQAFVNALNAQNGIANQSNVYNQLQGVANGTGPNPAQAMLNNATGQNVANQAALMAGQRGASSNVGLIARQTAQQGAATQQQAVGQGAALQSQQQLNALSGLGSLATQQVGQQQNAINAYNAASQGNQSNLYGLQANQNNANAGIAQQNAKAQTGMIGELTGNVGSALAALAHGGEVKGYANGDVVLPPANPYYVAPQGTQPISPTAPQSFLGRYLQGVNAPQNENSLGIGKGIGQGVTALVKAFKSKPAPTDASSSALPPEDDTVESSPTDLEEDEDFVSPSSQAITQNTAGVLGGSAGAAGLSEDAGLFAAGGEASDDSSKSVLSALPALLALLNKGGSVKNLKTGGGVPGKAKVAGDSLKNDTVAAKLSPGEIVLPRSVTQSKDPAGNAAKFVEAILARQNMGKRG